MKENIDPVISNAEWQVMEAIWKRHPISSREITLELEREFEWKSQTIKTLISRLVKKGFLKYEVIGNRYVYEPEIGRTEVVRAETESFISRVGLSAFGPVLAQFVNSSEKLTEADLESLRKILDQKGEENE